MYRSAGCERLNLTQPILPVTAAASTSALLSVSSPTTTNCIAVGYEGVSDPLAASWNGVSWTIQTIPGTAALTGVSCPTTDLCWAVGGNGSRVAEEWNGSAWTLQSRPTPTGVRSTSLTGISCPSASNCVAVGDYTNSQGSVMTLAEQWNGTQLVDPGHAQSARLDRQLPIRRLLPNVADLHRRRILREHVKHRRHARRDAFRLNHRKDHAEGAIAGSSPIAQLRCGVCDVKGFAAMDSPRFAAIHRDVTGRDSSCDQPNRVEESAGHSPSF
jgi:hypothetical protein